MTNLMDHRKAQGNAMKDYRAGERNAVAIAQSYEAKPAVQVQRDEEKAAVSIAQDYKAREREKQNAVDATRWAGTKRVYMRLKCFLTPVTLILLIGQPIGFIGKSHKEENNDI